MRIGPSDPDHRSDMFNTDRRPVNASVKSMTSISNEPCINSNDLLGASSSSVNARRRGPDSGSPFMEKTALVDIACTRSHCAALVELLRNLLAQTSPLLDARLHVRRRLNDAIRLVCRHLHMMWRVLRGAIWPGKSMSLKEQRYAAR